jgi:hypothetical protein
MKKTLVGIAVVSSLVLSGCVVHVGNGDWDDNDRSHWQSQQKENRNYINSVDLGTGVKEVINALGEADFVEAYEKDGKTVKVLFYRTHHKSSDGSTTKDETTPLVFVNGVLKGIGKKAYQNHL